MNKINEKEKVAIIMTVKNEQEYIDLNISYHLDLGFDYIFIANHQSTDNTSKILNSYSDSKVIVTKEDNSIFDHAIITNKLLKYAKDNYDIDWFIFLDADEFLNLKDKNIHEFIQSLNDDNIPYATVGWANALFDYTYKDFRCSPVNPIDTSKYYYPWSERDWQEKGHFRKTIIRNHENLEVIVGGHYIKSEGNKEFLREYYWNPYIVPFDKAMIMHYEFRGKPEDILSKWKKLAEFEKDSTSKDNAPWLERIDQIRQYVKEFDGNTDLIKKKWFDKHRTFWGTKIPEDRIIYDDTLIMWYRKYFRRKIENKEVDSVCLVRESHLGDIIMTEPVANFLSNYVKEVNLFTKNRNAKKIFSIYNNIYSFDELLGKENGCDLRIKLVYELCDNTKTYINGFFESIGFSDVETDRIPNINSDWDNIVNEKYFLIAPNTSSWEENKRNWGAHNFLELAKILEAEYGIKCVILEDKYSFNEMMSLIFHCEYFIGNDSGPGIISQSFNKKSFIIFGATHPKYLHLSRFTIPIYDKNRHALCQHKTRQEEIDCCESFCMDKLKVIKVFEIIKNNYE